MTVPDDLMRKAETALSSARHLLDLGDVEGAADRAYYGLFHAARAFLLHSAAAETEKLKTHTSVIAAFGLIGVRGAGLSPGHGRLLNFAEELRRKADYDSDRFADRAAVESILTDAGAFVADIQSAITKDQGP